MPCLSAFPCNVNVWLFFCISVFLSHVSFESFAVFISIILYVCLIVYHPAALARHHSFCLSGCVAGCLTVCLCDCLSILPSFVCLYVSLCVCLFVFIATFTSFPSYFFLSSCCSGILVRANALLLSTILLSDTCFLFVLLTYCSSLRLLSLSLSFSLFCYLSNPLSFSLSTFLTFSLPPLSLSFPSSLSLFLCIPVNTAQQSDAAILIADVQTIIPMRVLVVDDSEANRKVPYHLN